MPYFPLTGYAPDAEPSTPGIVADVDLMVPTLNGLKALPSDSDVGVGTAVSAIRSAKTLSMSVCWLLLLGNPCSSSPGLPLLS